MWGLSAYLVKTGYGVDEIEDASYTWLRFIRPDYYVAVELEKEGIKPEQFGLTSKGSCDAGRCNSPFYSQTSSKHLGGCGGMKKLITAEGV